MRASCSTRSPPPSPSSTDTGSVRGPELKDNGLQIIREAVALVEGKGTPEEVDEYKRFVVTLAHKVAAAHREHGTDVSPAEQAAIDEISATLGT